MTELGCLVGDSASGKNKIWKIEVIENKDKTGTIKVTHGYEGMKMVVSEKVICEGKNKGKKNETTAIQQAYLEARSAWTKKKDSGYVLYKELYKHTRKSEEKSEKYPCGDSSIIEHIGHIESIAKEISVTAKSQ